MIDELLEGVFGEIALGRGSNSRRAQLLARMFFGLLGSILAGIGGYHFATNAATANGPLRINIIALFFFLGCFSLFNITLARKWRWPGIFFVLSFVSLFVTRILFGP